MTSLAGQLSPARLTRTAAATHQFMGGDIIFGFDHGQLGLGLPVERQIEMPGKICQREPSSSSTMWLSE
ncbi:hypothetical protein [uncultured Bradyrhizobium sp.]|uniref:hypothetical protein n=1 Tax=uncultured Bradyrhizobium sp. TaxID=199684 RepID=UPI00261EF389|nr:hypothetical protein [uncultured Bradyrhizobium sp.]